MSKRLPLVALLAVCAAFACSFDSCEVPGELFTPCGEGGECEGGLSCYGQDFEVGYCTAACYQRDQCPAEAVCYEGACVLICDPTGDPCMDGTTCTAVEGDELGRGICARDGV